MSPKEPLVTCVSISLFCLSPMSLLPWAGGAGDSLCIKWGLVGWWWVPVCLVKAWAASPCHCSLSLRGQTCRSFFPLIHKGWVSCKRFAYKPATPTISFLAQSEVLCEYSETGSCCHLTGLWFGGGKKEPRALLSQCRKQKKCKAIKKKKHPNGSADLVVGRWMTPALLPLSGRLLSLWTSQLNRKPLGRTLLCF